jgi:uncharacterized membrane protein YdcZ (DUF606 family)
VAAQQVTSPDQHKPNNLKWWRIGGILSVIFLLAMLQPFNNHRGWVEDLYLVLTAALIAGALIGDAVLRRRGLRR